MKGELMKRIYLVVFLGASMVHPVLASPVGFGIRAGVNMANQTNSYFNYLNPDVLFGFSGGIFVEFPLNDFLSVQPEGEFTMKGIQLNPGSVAAVNSSGQVIGYTSGGTESLDNNYFEFPVLLKAHKQLSPHLIGNLSIGPSVEFPFTTYNHISAAGINENNTTNDVVPDGSVLFGVGLETDGFLIDLRYDLGLTGVYQHDPGGTQNSVLSLNLGYRIQ